MEVRKWIFLDWGFRGLGEWSFGGFEYFFMITQRDLWVLLAMGTHIKAKTIFKSSVRTTGIQVYLHSIGG